MLRSEIQNKTGLTRKAIEYYEEKGLITPKKLKNGYRDYSETELEALIKISLFRKIGMNISEIEECLTLDAHSLSSILRKKQHQLDIEEKRKDVIELIIKGESQKLIDEKVALIEVEQSIYERLERAFPGYFGQLIFASYQIFLNEKLEEDRKEAYYKYVNYLDNLPAFELSREEQNYIDNISSTFDMKTLEEVNKAKIDAIENVEQWLKDNKDILLEYADFKNSEEYQNSLMKKIQEKFQQFMIDNKYYEIGIPLIRQFSKSYDEYYKKLLDANDKYMNSSK